MNTPTDLKLIETILWEKGAFFLLDLHLSRLEKSAAELSFFCNVDEVREVLSDMSRNLDPEQPYRVRLTVDKRGELDMSCTPLAGAPEEPLKLVFSDKSVDKNDISLIHKTTDRALYNATIEKARNEGFYDAVFLNRDGEVTEGCITNIIIKKGAEYFTPPVSCGLLPGVYRAFLLNGNDITLKEKALSKEDLLYAEKIFVCNSVIKMLPAVFPSGERTL